jgi:diamine N-acetyltransferase
MLEVAATKDHKLIAALTGEAQDLHARLYPGIFKPFNKIEMEKVFADRFTDRDYYAFVARQDGVEIGCAVLFIREAKENAFHYTLKTLHVDQICVLNKFQRSGAGKLLLQQIEKLARDHAIKKIELDHWSDNVIAASFFRKNGYGVSRQRLFKEIG